MSNEKLEVFWDNELLGYIVNPKVDNFDMYGTWVPEPGGPLAKLLEQLDSAGEVSLTMGTKEPPLRGTLEIEPDDEIEIKLRSS